MPDDQTPPAGGTAPPPEKTFTQVELDNIVRDRLTRERDKFRDYEDLKGKATKLADIENASKSESEKLAARLAAIEQQIGLKDQTIASLTNELTGTKRANLAGSVAGRLGAHDPQDANILAAISGIDPAGANAEQEIDAALRGLQTSKPYLFKSPGQGNTQPAVTAFNPAGGAAAESDMQRVQRLQRQSGARGYGPLG
jgi:hypothetical protein